MADKHACQNLCGEQCDCGKSKEKCTYCSGCIDAPADLQCDYCTNRATLECPGCEELFLCVDHEDNKDDGCDQCRCPDCNTYPCICNEDEEEEEDDEENDDEDSE